MYYNRADHQINGLFFNHLHIELNGCGITKPCGQCKTTTTIQSEATEIRTIKMKNYSKLFGKFKVFQRRDGLHSKRASATERSVGANNCDN